MSIGEGIGQGLMFAAQQIAANKKAKRDQQSQIDLFKLKQAAELEAEAVKDEKEKQYLANIQVPKGYKKEKRQLEMSDLMDFVDARTGQAEKIDRATAERKLANLESVLGRGTEATPTMIKQRDALKSFISQSPQYQEVEIPEYYSQDELFGLKKAGVLDEIYKASLAEKEEKARLERLMNDPTVPMKEKIAIKASILAGKGGASLGREFYINPYEQSRIAYTDRKTQDVGEDNTRQENQFVARQDLGERKFGETQRHNKVSEGQGQQRINTGLMPTYSESVNSDGEVVKRVTRKGTSKPQQGNSGKKSNKAQILAAIKGLN